MTNEEAIKELEKIAQFKTEAVSVPVYMGIRALEKGIPQKYNGKFWQDGKCPVCKEDVTYDNIVRYSYCPNCGQAIDWSDQE